MTGFDFAFNNPYSVMLIVFVVLGAVYSFLLIA